MNCLVTYEHRGNQNNITIQDATENNWFDKFRSQYNYDTIISHTFLKQNTKIKMNCLVIYIYRGNQSSTIVQEVTDNDWLDKFRSKYSYDVIISHTFIK